MTNEEMMGMLATKNPCDNPPGMSFDPTNPTELAAGAQATLDIIGGLPPYTFEIFQGSLFYIDDSYIAWPPGYSDTYIKASSKFSTSYWPHFAADPTLARHGVMTSLQWVSANGNPSQQRWNIDLGSSKIINQIMLENAHHEGGSLTHGIKNFVLQGSNDANSLAQVDYSSDTYWTNIETGLQAAQHAAEDFDDPQSFDITNETAYRYLSLKIADNWGEGAYMGIRHVQFHTSQEKVYKIITDDPQVTITAPNYALWTARVKCTDFCDQVDNAWLWSSSGKWDSVYSYSGGGSPTPCGNAAFRCIKNGVMFYATVCNSNGIGTFGDHVYDCSAYGGESHTINIFEECDAGPDCDHVQNIEYFCWPFP